MVAICRPRRRSDCVVGHVRWAEKELHMMKLFFDNLQHYIQEVREQRHKFAL